jgi:hypothetical protein
VQLDGHPWIGQTVLRFYDGQPTRATIVKWAAAAASEPALWHLEHEDGDEEDLEEAETDVAVKLWTEASMVESFPGCRNVFTLFVLQIESRIEQAQAVLEERCNTSRFSSPRFAQLDNVVQRGTGG